MTPNFPYTEKVQFFLSHMGS